MNFRNIKPSLLICLLGLLPIASCDNDSDDPQLVQIETNIQSGTWRVTKFIDSGNDETNHFSGFDFTFGSLTVLTASNGTVTYAGTWIITDGNTSDDTLDDLNFNIIFPQTNDFEDLNDNWEIISQSSTKLELTDVSGGGGGTDFLTFEKN